MTGRRWPADHTDDSASGTSNTSGLGQQMYGIQWYIMGLFGAQSTSRLMSHARGGGGVCVSAIYITTPSPLKSSSQQATTTTTTSSTSPFRFGHHSVPPPRVLCSSRHSRAGWGPDSNRLPPLCSYVFHRCRFPLRRKRVFTSGASKYVFKTCRLVGFWQSQESFSTHPPTPAACLFEAVFRRYCLTREGRSNTPT